MEYKKLPPRISNQKVFVADIQKINSSTGWKLPVTAIDRIVAMIDWVRESK